MGTLSLFEVTLEVFAESRGEDEGLHGVCFLVGSIVRVRVSALFLVILLCVWHVGTFDDIFSKQRQRSVGMSEKVGENVLRYP